MKGFAVFGTVTLMAVAPLAAQTPASPAPTQAKPPAPDGTGPADARDVTGSAAAVP